MTIGDLQNLGRLIGSFHQDWLMDAPTWEGVVTRFVDRFPLERSTKSLEELDALLASDASEQELGHLILREMYAAYNPTYGGSTWREWLTAMRVQLAHDVSAKMGKRGSGDD